MKTVQCSAQIDRISSRKDRTLSVVLNTQEMSPKETGQLFDFQGLQIWVAFAETALTYTDLEIPDTMVATDDTKSPSERLRAVLFVYYKQNESKLNKPFDTFYREQMERYIDSIKAKLTE
jgi:hypothetical protein